MSANKKHTPKRADKKHTPKRAMVLAAGLGTRMGTLSDEKPKPLFDVHGRTLIDRAIDRLDDIGVKHIVVNLHHMGDVMRAHLEGRPSPDIIFSEEPAILDTGGGVKNALSHFGDDPFLVINGDALWLNGSENALQRLCQMWDDKTMDALLLVHSTVDAYGYRGNGDFTVGPRGRVRRRAECEVAPYVFTGIQILHPRLFKDTPDGAFSLNRLYDKAIEAERLFAVVHDGEWFHINTPNGLEAARDYMQTRYAGMKRR